MSAILAALYRGQADEARRLASEPNAADLSVHEAAALGHVDDLRTLLSIDPGLANAWSADGFQPLGLACFFGHADAATLLLEQGADVNAPARNAFRVTALHAALAGSDPQIARALIAAGADVGARQQGNVTALHAAASLGDRSLVQLLLEHRARADVRDDQGRSPADLARATGHPELAVALDRTADQAS